MYDSMKSILCGRDYILVVKDNLIVEKPRNRESLGGEEGEILLHLKIICLCGLVVWTCTMLQ